MRKGAIFLIVGVLALASMRVEPAGAVPPAPFIVTDVSPDPSTVPPQQHGGWAGRINGIAVQNGNPNVAYAATEWGGLYRTTDGGANWSRLNEHRANAVWDVALDPQSCADTTDNGGDTLTDKGDPDCHSDGDASDATSYVASLIEDSALPLTVYSTSFYDGRTPSDASDAGINVSTDGGVTWSHPTVPDTGTCTGQTTILNDPAGWSGASGEPSAFGIAVRPDAAHKVFVGTKCGVAISLDSGATWNHIDPNPATIGGRVWDVAVHDHGIIDVCGDEGHFRSLDDGQSWVRPDLADAVAQLVAAGTNVFATCSIAASPVNPDVIFVIVGAPGIVGALTLPAGVYESDDGGQTWTNINPIGGGRPVYVVSNLTDATPESGLQCNDNADTDGDTFINEGCPVSGTDKEDSDQCGNAIDDDGDNTVNDGCPASGAPESGANCQNATNDDGDGAINDGCPAIGGPATEVLNTCGNDTDDDDLDGKINDGCPARGFPEFGPQCTGANNGVDNDGDTIADDGCGGGDPATDAAAEVACADDLDNDLDGFINDGCAVDNNTNVSSGDNSEGTDVNQCDIPDTATAGDSDADGPTYPGRANDGCPLRTFDIYFGNGVQTMRMSCTNQAGMDCAGATTQVDVSIHADPEDIEFDPTSPVPRCPLYISNDAGVYKSNDCGVTWARSDTGIHAQWLWDIDGAQQAGPPVNTDLYIGAQDVGLSTSKDAGGAWANTQCCDVFDIESDASGAIFTLCCGPGTNLRRVVFNDNFPEVDLCDTVVANRTDDDGDGAVNDGCPVSGIAETPAQCANDLDDDADNAANDGCAAVGPPEVDQCQNGTDDEDNNPTTLGVQLDTVVNDGCATPLANNPPGTLKGFQQLDSIDQWAAGSYVAATTAGVSITTNTGASAWTLLGTGTVPPNVCAVQATVSGGVPTFYAVTAGAGANASTIRFECSGGYDDDRDGMMNEDITNGVDDDLDLSTDEDPGGELWKFTGTGAGSWTRLPLSREAGGGANSCFDTIDNGGDPGIDFADPDCKVTTGMYAAHPKDPMRLYMTRLAPSGPTIISSIDGGTTWTPDATLTSLVAGSGVKPQPVTGALDLSTHGVYAQPSLLEISPHATGASSIVVAGSHDSGVFISEDFGSTWKKVAIIARCDNGLDEDGDGTNDDGCNGAVTATPPAERDEDIPRPWDAYFDASGTFYIGTQGRGIWKVSGLGATPISTDTAEGVSCGIGNFFSSLVRMAPSGTTVSAHLSDLHKVLQMLDVSLAGDSGLNLGNILNTLSPGTVTNLQQIIDRLEQNVTEGGLSGNVGGVDVLIDAGFDFEGGPGGILTLDLNLTLSKTVNAPLDLSAGGDTAGLNLDGDAPVTLTLNAAFKFGFDDSLYNTADPDTCKDAFFVEFANLKFTAQTNIEDLVISARLGFFELTTDDQFDTPGEPDEGADISASADVTVVLVDPDPSSPAPNRITVREIENTGIEDLIDITPHGLVDANIPLRTNLFDVTAPETGADCSDSDDDDRDGKTNDGCPADGTAEADAQCANNTNDDGDGAVNDGCPRSDPRVKFHYSLNPGNPSLEFQDMGALNPFNNLSALGFLTALGELLDWLQSLQNTGVLDTELPFTDASIGDVVAVADRLHAALTTLIDPNTGQPDFKDAEDFQAKFRAALALALGLPEESIPELPLDYDHLARTLTYELNLEDEFSTGAGEGRTPTCADGVENKSGPPDGADTADTDCHTDANASNADSYDGSRPEDGVQDGTCADGVDNDGGGGTDMADADCHIEDNPAKPYVAGRSEGRGTCDDGADNDADNQIDNSDAQCKAPLNFSEDLEVINGVQLSADATAAVTAGYDLNLTFGLDLRDFPDNPVESPGGAEDSCRDNVDNDSMDGMDGLDPDCGPKEAGGGLGSCADTIDNNADGITDALAPECNLMEGGASCYNGMDDDGDLFKDLADGECLLTIEDRLFIKTDGPGPELKLDLQFEADVTASALIGILGVSLENGVATIGASEDPTTNTCNDGADNGGGDGMDIGDADCHTDGNAGNMGSYSIFLPEDGKTNADCGDGKDNDDDGAEIKDGTVDVDGDDAAPPDTGDDGTIAGVDIIDGGVDLNDDGQVDENDVGEFAGLSVIGGKIDFDGSGTVDGSDDGSLFQDGNDPQCNVLTIDLTDPAGGDERITLPELLAGLNDITSLIDADINGFIDAKATISATLGGATLASGDLIAGGGVSGPLVVDGSEDGAGPDTCTDGNDNQALDDPTPPLADGADDEDTDCSPLVAGITIDAHELDIANLLDFNTDDPLAILIRLLEMIDGLADQIQQQEGGLLNEPLPLVGGSVADILSYAGDLADLADGMRVAPEGDFACIGDGDEDAADEETPGPPPDSTLNDGCPGGPAADGAPETDWPCRSGDSNDDDADGFVNDGCPAKGFNEEDATNPCLAGFLPPCGLGAGDSCANAVDDDGDGIINDGCPGAQSEPFPEGDCEAPGGPLDPSPDPDKPGLDDDNDGFPNDGCPTAQPTLQLVEKQIEGLLPGGMPETICGLAGDEDGDSLHNEGCTQVGGASETGTQCENDVNDGEADGAVNDGCPDNLTIQLVDTVAGSDLKFHLRFGLSKTKEVSLNLDLSTLGISADLIGLETHGTLTANVQGRLDLDFGIEMSGADISAIQFFLEPTSDLIVSASVGSQNFEIKGNVGPLTAQIGATAEIGSQCANDDDDDSVAADSLVNEGCPAVPGPGLTGAENPQCADAVDASEDGGADKVNDGCPQAGADPETGADCNNDTDEGGDGYVNDGCPEVGLSEDQLQCKNNTDDDADAGGEVNDGCPAAPPSANLGASFHLTIDDPVATPGKIYFAELTPSIFNSNGGLAGPVSNPADCGADPVCAKLPIYLEGKYLCTLKVTFAFPATFTATVTEPPNCGIAAEIANAVLDLLLLESGLGDLLDMLENLLNGNLFGFKLPLLGNLGLGTDFVGKLRENLMQSVTEPGGSGPADALQTAAAETVVAKIDEFRDYIANALIDPAGDGDGVGQQDDRLLKDRGNDGLTTDDLKFVLICDVTDPVNPKACGYGPELECDDAADTTFAERDDDNDGKVNDGCAAVDTSEFSDECGGTGAAADNDGDGRANDGCPTSGPAEEDPGNPCGGASTADCGPNGGDSCADLDDDDDDGVTNDGCPVFGPANPETVGARCDNDTDDHATGTKRNDGCPIKNPDGFNIEEIRFFATIGQEGGANPDIGFDLNLPGLNLTSTGQVNLGYDWEVNIGFGVSKSNAFFLLTEPMEDGLRTATCTDGMDNDDDNDDGTLDSTVPTDDMVDADDPDCDATELNIGGQVELGGPATSISAKIAGFLLLQVSDATPNNPGHEDAHAEFIIDMTDPMTEANDGRTTFTEILSAPSFSDVVSFDLQAAVNANLKLLTTIDLDGDGQLDPAIPQLLGDLKLHWGWSLAGNNASEVENNTGECDGNTANDELEACLSASLDNFRINIGSFLTNMIGPVAEEIQVYTKPIQPAIDILVTPIPVLSDLAGTPITLLDLIITLGSGDLDMLDEIVAVINFINSFDLEAIDPLDLTGPSGLVIPIAPDTDAGSDDYTLAASKLTKPLADAKDAYKAGELTALESTNMLDDIEEGTGAADDASTSQKGILASLKMLTEEAGVSFPFLEKPSDLMQLMFGKDLTLVLWEPPNLQASFGYSQSFGPIWAVPPVFVHIGGSVTLKGHFGLGYDTEGIRQVVGGADAITLLNGLFLADTSNGQDVPEFSMRGELVAGASISVLIFSAGAEGGIFLTINIDLQDPNADGKLKFVEIADIIEITGNPLCIFILSGEFGVFLRVFVEVDLFFWSHRWTFTLAEIVLWSFQVECDLDPEPNLATKVGSVLYLNMGPRTAERGGFPNAEDEEFTVIKNAGTGRLEVHAFGFIECDFDDDGACNGDDGGITRVEGSGGDGKDVIAALPNTMKEEDGLQTCGDGLDNSDVANGEPPNNGDGMSDTGDPDCHTDSDETNSGSFNAGLAEDDIDACSDKRDNSVDLPPGPGIPDGKADKGVKVNGDADFTDPGEFPPDPDCAGEPIEFDIPVVFNGDGDDDKLTGGIVNDILRGGDDKDTINAGRGNDDVIGGNGDDELIGDKGFDVIIGDVGTIDDNVPPVNGRTGDPAGTDTTVAGLAGTGADYVDAGLDNDHVWGVGGNDNLGGGLSDTTTMDLADRIHGGDGDDTIDGGDGGDRLFGDAGQDNIIGSGGDDRIEGGNETAVLNDIGDNLLGSAGADRIFGEDGQDNVIGGDGADPELRGGAHNDVMLGDNGIVFRAEPGAGTNPSRHNDTVQIDPGADGGDNMHGDTGNDWLFGQGGGDTMECEGGEVEDGAGAGSCDDAVDNGGGDAIDSADPDCAGGDDDLIGGPDGDAMNGGPGVDIMLGDTGTVDHHGSSSRGDDSAVFGDAVSEGGDTMNGNASNDKMFGQGGNDIMNGGGGADLMEGNGNDDDMFGSRDNDTMRGNSGSDDMEGNQGTDGMGGGSANDRMIGGSSTAGVDDVNDNMFGETGADVMIGDNGTISGFDANLLNLNPIGGNDYMEGNDANDDMYGGPGRDKMLGQGGDDYMEGNNDSDVMTGGADQDDMIGGSSFESAGVEGTIADSGDNMDGGESFDVMAGDNASILRPGGDGSFNTFNPSVIRTVKLYDVDEVGEAAIAANLSGGDIMTGGTHDDVMYGGGNFGHTVNDDGDGATDEDPPDGVNNDGDGATDEDGGQDVMHGNDGDDYMEGNHGSDLMFGDLGQDDMIGGGSDDYEAGPEPDLRDADDTMYGESAAVQGTAEGSHADAMDGDNAAIARPLVPSGPDMGDWQTNTFNGAVTRLFTLLDVETVANDPLSADLSGADIMWGNDNDDVMYGQGEIDDMHGNAGEDYMEGNSGSDAMTGDDGNDDMVGGTGRINADPPTGTNGRTDDGETNMTGGNGFDNMAGDNAIIKRTLDGNGQWIAQTFRDCDPDPDEACNGVQHERIILLDVNSPDMPDVSGGDIMFGNDDDDVMYGQGNGADFNDDADARIDEDPVDGLDNDGDSATDEDAGGDVMHGNDDEDYMEGNHGADFMYGDSGQDDLIGGTGRIGSDPAAGVDGRVDGDDNMFGESDMSQGSATGNGADTMTGDNAIVTRPLIVGGPDDGDWKVNSFNGAFTRIIKQLDVENTGNAPLSVDVHGDDRMWGNDNDDVMYGQGGDDEMHGNAGEDYMEGNAANDTMTGDAGQDDMLGGTGPTTSNDPATAIDGRTDGDDVMTGESDMSQGLATGDGADYMIGDNGRIIRPLITSGPGTGGWQMETFNGNFDRVLTILDVELGVNPPLSALVSGDDDMWGNDNDDAMYGQGGNDEMHGNAGEDYMEGNAGNDTMTGDVGQDDLIGGTGASTSGNQLSTLTSGEKATAVNDRTDGDDDIFGEDSLSGQGTENGDGADVILGDNGTIERPLDLLLMWEVNTFNGNFTRLTTLLDVEFTGSGNYPLDPDLSGDDEIWGNDNDDIVYGQGGNDLIHGNAGFDYLEGNAASDMMFGEDGEDDMLGGSGPTVSKSQLAPLGAEASASAVPGRTDVSTMMRNVPLGTVASQSVPLGDTMYGGNGADEMIGDNGTINRLIPGGQWVTLNYSTLADHIGDVAPRHPTGPASSRIDREVAMLETTPGLTANSDLMFGGDGDDQMYGQFDETAGATQPAIGDEMHGENGEDAMAGDQGNFLERKLTTATVHIKPNEPFVDDDIFIQNSLYREFRMLQIPTGGNDRMRGGNGGDWMHGGAGADVANGDNGNDHIFGNNGDDDIWGGRHHDHIWGGRDRDQLDLHPRVTESNSLPNACGQLSPADPQEWYTFAFEGGLATTTCDGNFEDVDYIYGGWDADALQANVGDNGPKIGDRLFDWVGVYNLYILCPGTYGEFVSTREFSPQMTEFLHRLAEGDGAYRPGTAITDPSGFNEIAFVFRPDLKFNKNPPYVDTPAHFNCTTDSITIP